MQARFAAVGDQKYVLQKTHGRASPCIKLSRAFVAAIQLSGDEPTSRWTLRGEGKAVVARHA